MKEYEQAVPTFKRRNGKYARKIAELNRKKEESRIKTYAKVEQTETELCYVEINSKETIPLLSERYSEGTSVSKNFPLISLLFSRKKDS